MAESLDDKQTAMKAEMQTKRHALLDDVNSALRLATADSDAKHSGLQAQLNEEKKNYSLVIEKSVRQAERRSAELEREAAAAAATLSALETSVSNRLNMLEERVTDVDDASKRRGMDSQESALKMMRETADADRLRADENERRAATAAEERDREASRAADAMASELSSLKSQIERRESERAATDVGRERDARTAANERETLIREEIERIEASAAATAAAAAAAADERANLLATAVAATAARQKGDTEEWRRAESAAREQAECLLADMLNETKSELLELSEKLATSTAAAAVRSDEIESAAAATAAAVTALGHETTNIHEQNASDTTVWRAEVTTQLAAAAAAAAAATAAVEADAAARDDAADVAAENVQTLTSEVTTLSTRIAAVDTGLQKNMKVEWDKLRASEHAMQASVDEQLIAEKSAREASIFELMQQIQSINDDACNRDRHHQGVAEAASERLLSAERSRQNESEAAAAERDAWRDAERASREKADLMVLDRVAEMKAEIDARDAHRRGDDEAEWKRQKQRETGKKRSVFFLHYTSFNTFAHTNTHTNELFYTFLQRRKSGVATKKCHAKRLLSV
jgi:hypothetical protein